jgi:hypothetical protein
LKNDAYLWDKLVGSSALLADALPYDFGNALIDRYMTDEGSAIKYDLHY